MGEVLSQSEIDNLLQALSTGELDVEVMKEDNERQVKNYDFKRPAKFSKDHLRTLEIIFRTLWTFIIYKLAGIFKKKCSGYSCKFGNSNFFGIHKCFE